MAIRASISAVSILLLAVATVFAGEADDGPFPVPVADFEAPAPGEHPRLFFRPEDVAGIRARAATPEGKRIVARLKALLGGGEAMPEFYNGSPYAYHGNFAVTREELEELLAARPAPRPGTGNGIDGAGDAKRAKIVAEAEAADPESGGGDELDEGLLDDLESLGEEKGAKEQPKRERQGKARGIPEGTYTISHAAGFGMLYQLTGERKYADLGWECVELAFRGVRDRDDRYSWADPGGALRAGPSLGWYALAYDLCYDGWSEERRREMARALFAYDWGDHERLAELARGARHFPKKNHWGGQVGGAALALLAIRGDPGVDADAVEELLEVNLAAMRRQLDEGLGDHGYYYEHAGPGGITTDTAYVPALQAWKVAGGRDFISPREQTSYLPLIRIYECYHRGDEPWYLLRHPSSYGTGRFTAKGGDRDGLSRGGQFAQGFGVVQERFRPALLWGYRTLVEPDPERRTFDTVSPYPHRAVLSLVNWPIGVEPENPTGILPLHLVDERHRYFVCRERWKDGDDLVVSLLTLGRPDGGEEVLVGGRGMFTKLGRIERPWGTVGQRDLLEDGSALLGFPKGGGWFAIDYSGRSGADLVVAIVGTAAKPSDDPRAGRDRTGPRGHAAKFTRLESGEEPWMVLTVHEGEVADGPEVAAIDGGIRVGERRILFDGERIAFGE